MSLHAKEVAVINFIEEFRMEGGQDPDLRDVCARFTVDSESIAIAIKELQMDGQEDFLRNLKYKLHPEIIKDRVQTYIDYPHLFSLFLEKDLRTALATFQLNLDRNFQGREIINALIKDRRDYLTQIIELNLFEDDKIEVEVPNYKINAESLIKGLLTELTFTDSLVFSDQMHKAYYIYFKLYELSKMASGFDALVEKILNKNENREFASGNVFLVGKIRTHGVVFKVNLNRLEEVIQNFEVPQEIDKEKLLKSLKEVGSDNAIEWGADLVGSVIPGFSFVAKVGTSLLKVFNSIKGKSDTEHISETYRLYKESGISTIRKFHISELRKVMKAFCKESRLDYELIPYEFYEVQFRKFMQTYENRSMILEETLRKQIYELNGEEKDNAMFEQVSLASMNRGHVRDVLPA